MDFVKYLNMVQEFSGDSKCIEVEIYIKKFENIANLANWSEAEKIIILRNKMVGWARDVLWADDEWRKIQNYEKFKEVMIDYFRRAKLPTKTKENMPNRDIMQTHNTQKLNYEEMQILYNLLNSERDYEQGESYFKYNEIKQDNTVINITGHLAKSCSNNFKFRKQNTQINDYRENIPSERTTNDWRHINHKRNDNQNFKNRKYTRNENQNKYINVNVKNSIQKESRKRDLQIEKTMYNTHVGSLEKPQERLEEYKNTKDEKVKYNKRQINSDKEYNKQGQKRINSLSKRKTREVFDKLLNNFQSALDEYEKTDQSLKNEKHLSNNQSELKGDNYYNVMTRKENEFNVEKQGLKNSESDKKNQYVEEKSIHEEIDISLKNKDQKAVNPEIISNDCSREIDDSGEKLNNTCLAQDKMEIKTLKEENKFCTQQKEKLPTGKSKDEKRDFDSDGVVSNISEKMEVVVSNKVTEEMEDKILECMIRVEIENNVENAETRIDGVDIFGKDTVRSPDQNNLSDKILEESYESDSGKSTSIDSTMGNETNFLLTDSLHDKNESKKETPLEGYINAPKKLKYIDKTTVCENVEGIPDNFTIDNNSGDCQEKIQNLNDVKHDIIQNENITTSESINENVSDFLTEALNNERYRERNVHEKKVETILGGINAEFAKGLTEDENLEKAKSMQIKTEKLEDEIICNKKKDDFSDYLLVQNVENSKEIVLDHEERASNDFSGQILSEVLDCKENDSEEILSRNLYAEYKISKSEISKSDQINRENFRKRTRIIGVGMHKKIRIARSSNNVLTDRNKRKHVFKLKKKFRNKLKLLKVNRRCVKENDTLREKQGKIKRIENYKTRRRKKYRRILLHRKINDRNIINIRHEH